jgi:hypothetical protein
LLGADCAGSGEADGDVFASNDLILVKRPDVGQHIDLFWPEHSAWYTAKILWTDSVQYVLRHGPRFWITRVQVDYDLTLRVPPPPPTHTLSTTAWNVVVASMRRNHTSRGCPLSYQSNCALS